MSELEVREVDPFDAVAFDAWHGVYAEAERFGREDVATVWQLEELRVQMQERSARAWTRAYAGLVDGRAVVAGWIRTPLLDNLDRAELSAHVLPSHRRRGLGSAMVAHLESVARERGRSILGAEAHWSYDAGSEGTGESGPGFAAALGYDLALGDVQRVLRLPVAAEVLDGLEREAAPHHAAYTLRSWVGRVPEDLLPGWVELSSSLMTEAPTGDLTVEPEKADLEAHREHEGIRERQGREKYNTVALDADGVVVAYSDIATTVHEPGRAYQWGTLVRRDHRGHRLGVAVKVANLRVLQRERPDVDHVVTYNAEVNAHMVGVNELLGYRPVARLGEFQKQLGS